MDLKLLFIKKTNNTAIQFLRYLFVGSFGFGVDFTALYLLTDFFHIYYLISAAFSFMLGVTTIYFLSTKWIFGNSLLKNKHVEFSIFTAIGLVGLVLTAISMFLLTEKLKIYYLYSKIITAMFVFMWNFFGRKMFLFK